MNVLSASSARRRSGCCRGSFVGQLRPISRSTRFSKPGIARRFAGCCRTPTSRSRRSSIATCFRRATRLRWVQSPAVGVGSLMFPELIASPVVITSARGIRARSIAEHVLGVTIALARQLPRRVPRADDASLGAGRARRATRLGPHAAGPADGHRRPRLDWPRGRAARRALRISRFRHSPPRRSAGARTASRLTSSGRPTACSSFSRRATSSFSPRRHTPRPAAHRPARGRGDEARRACSSTSRAAS